MGSGAESSGVPALPFWVSYDDQDVGDESEGDSMGLFGGRDDEVRLRNVPLGPLRRNLAEAVDALQEVFAEAAARGGPLPLREAHLSFQVTASGGVQFVGSAQVQRGHGIALVFKQ
ncbi:Pepco domain-containing protein [Streptomyces sp. CA-249302]|uniref:Pepco domain-containing protein n=1 Tax=Streptomyces sp. CA-249302 TaxID=3240058 RepID=UPI003D9383CE